MSKPARLPRAVTKVRPAICDIVTVDCPRRDSFFRDYLNPEGTEWPLQTWRVSGFLRNRPIPTLASLKTDCQDDFAARFIWNRIRREIKAGTYQPKREWCLPEQATHVCLVSVCGATVEIERCNVVGRVPWSAEMIANEAARVTAWAGRLAPS